MHLDIEFGLSSNSTKWIRPHSKKLSLNKEYVDDKDEKKIFLPDLRIWAPIKERFISVSPILLQSARDFLIGILIIIYY